MKITLVETDCRDKVSPNCTKTFMRKVQRGRPQVNCEACKSFKGAPVKTGTVESHEYNSESWKCIVNNGETDHYKRIASKIGNCPCGKTFEIKAGRGRKPSKCVECREAGTVYRRNLSTGEIDEIRAEALVEEQREIREQRGRDRAARLVEMMVPLVVRDAKRRASLV